MDNAIPLCLECHGLVEMYNPSHPKGTKIKFTELKKRRDQIYDEHTRHLVPSLEYRLDQRISQVDNGGALRSVFRNFPDVGFIVRHPGGTPSVQLLIALDLYLNGEKAKGSDWGCGLHYSGRVRWNLNPGECFLGHFEISNIAEDNGNGAQIIKPGINDIRVGINIVIHDCYDRPHKLLPVTYVWDRENNNWWLDPIAPEESAKEAITR